VQDTHAALGMGDVAFVAEAVNRAGQALREAELLVSAENVGLSLIGRATQRVQGLLEVAERAVGQQKKRQEELTRFKFAREEQTVRPHALTSGNTLNTPETRDPVRACLKVLAQFTS